MDPLRLEALLREHLRIPTRPLVALGVSVAVLFVGGLLYRLVFALLSRVGRATQTKLDDELVRRMRTPARALVGLLAIHAFAAMRGTQLPALRTVVVVVELFLAAYLAIEATETVLVHYWLGERKKIVVPTVVRHLLLVVVYTIAALSILGSVTGLNLVPLLATSTVVTVVLGLALQDTLGNFFAGLALHAEKPFSIGDWVLIDGIEGKVVYMGWRATRLETFTSECVAVPNSAIAKARVQNFSAPDPLCGRTVEMIVSPSAPPERVEKAVARACAKVAQVLAEPAPRAWLVGATPLFQRYHVRFWVADFPQYSETQSDLLKALWHECRGEGLAVGEAGASVAIEPLKLEPMLIASPKPVAAPGAGAAPRLEEPKGGGPA